jgi:hypothetical protein
MVFATVTIFTMLMYIPSFNTAVRRVVGGLAQSARTVVARRA